MVFLLVPELDLLLSPGLAVPEFYWPSLLFTTGAETAVSENEAVALALGRRLPSQSLP